jgi:hypothetical protein
MSRALRRPVEDFEAVFRAISLQKETVILVGGHAVNVWALSYRDRLGDVLTRCFRSPAATWTCMRRGMP